MASKPLAVLSKSAAILNPADFKYLVKTFSLEIDKFILKLRSNNALTARIITYSGIDGGERISNYYFVREWEFEFIYFA